MLDEDMDDVKHMNQMMLYSKIVTIRDAQIQEKRLGASNAFQMFHHFGTFYTVERHLAVTEADGAVGAGGGGVLHSSKKGLEMFEEVPEWI